MGHKLCFALRGFVPNKEEVGEKNRAALLASVCHRRVLGTQFGAGREEGLVESKFQVMAHLLRVDLWMVGKGSSAYDGEDGHGKRASLLALARRGGAQPAYGEGSRGLLGACCPAESAREGSVEGIDEG